nr:hypothetical protein DGKKSRWO_DGKKSRWO_CDS_0022 [uncultured phage]CAI9752141.1 hypothetical protein CVNMHQAP_CVNMHQAP_CDS_0022 [uncultured phage]
MATIVNVTADASWSFLSYFTFGGLGFSSFDGTKLLKSITLKCVKFTNYNHPILSPVSGAGYTTSLETVTLTLTVNGVSSETRTITNRMELTTPNSDGYYTQQSSYVNIPDTASDGTSNLYTFNFGSGVQITSDTKIICKVSDNVKSKKNGLAIRKSKGIAGSAVIDELGPSSITITPKENWITDYTGEKKNINNGILKDNLCTFSVNPVVASLSFDSSIVDCSYNSSSGVITCTAPDGVPYDYPDEDEITATTTNNVSDSFKIYFYEKELVNIVNYYVDPAASNITINIGQAATAGYKIQNYPITSSARANRLYINNQDYGTFDVSNNNSLIPISQLLGFSRDTENKLSIANENKVQNLDWIFYNSAVQTFNSVSSSYLKKLPTKITYSITPTDVNQFSFDWLDTSGNIATEPDIILVNQDSAVPGNLVYSNESATGGFCRGFRLEFITPDGTVARTEERDTSVTSGESKWSGKLFTKDSLSNLEHKVQYTIKITAYFYFNKDVSFRYYGASFELTPKLLILDAKDILPSLVFPVVSDSQPYTHILLEDVERFGYSFDDTILALGILDGSEFNIKVNDSAIPYGAGSKFFSSNERTKNIIFDFGSFVKENKLYVEQCKVKPSLTLTVNGKQQILEVESDTELPNVIVSTTEEGMWKRPKTNSGALISYYDYVNFMNFINRYHKLVNDKLLIVPTNRSGSIVSVDYWKDIANKLDEYAVNMQNWATDVINTAMLWLLPEFKHQKGEKFTIGNLYQNYYDLLIQYCAYERLATHDYLNKSSYTHDYLSNYTHDQITNKEMG